MVPLAGLYRKGYKEKMSELVSKLEGKTYCLTAVVELVNHTRSRIAISIKVAPVNHAIEIEGSTRTARRVTTLVDAWWCSRDVTIAGRLTRCIEWWIQGKSPRASQGTAIADVEAVSIGCNTQSDLEWP